MTDLREIADILQKKSQIYIFSHMSPDGDALGSQVALGLALKQLGKEVRLYNKDIVPKNFSFLNSFFEINLLEQLEKKSDVLYIFLDSANFDRVGLEEKETNLLINIDHHISNDLYGDLNYVESEASSTCEVIYGLIALLGVEFTEEISTALYTGLSTDTGSFMYSNTSPKTHLVAAKLIESGANTAGIRSNLYESMSKEKLLLTKKALSSLDFLADSKIAYLVLELEDFSETGAESSDSGHLVSMIKNVAGVELAIVIKEKEENIFKVSFRSKEYVDVNKLAQNFGGGGHVRAAGCSLEGSKPEVLERILRVSESFL